MANWRWSIATWLFLRTAFAQPAVAPADATVEQAREHFFRGVALAETGRDWDAALAEFQASRALHRTRAATRNAALALQHLGRLAEAVELYQVLLRDFGASLDDAQRAEAERDLAASLSRVGRLTIRVSEAGANVVVDEQQRGTTPLPEGLLVDAGTHIVRVSKSGFDPQMVRTSVTQGGTAIVDVPLTRALAAGSLRITEESGGQYDVLVDSALVGKTPWEGEVTPGTHHITLRDGTRGTAPSSADVRAGQAIQLTLRAVALDTALRIMPTPSNATVLIDGVSVGLGIWAGRLPAGRHRIELSAPGHVTLVRYVELRAGGHEILPATLEREPSPSRVAPKPRELYGELLFGGLLSGSIGGSADDSCPCPERERPQGLLGGARLGYVVAPRIGLELSLGYLTLSESMRRTLSASREEGPPLVSTDYQDATRLAGPLGTLGASYRVFERFPVTGRAAVGLAWLGAWTSNGGHYDDGGESRYLSAAESAQRLLAATLSAELRVGYRFSPRWSADVGAGFIWFFPEAASRLGANNIDEQRRLAALESGELVQLPSERVASAFLAWTPSVAVRLAF